MHSRKKLEKIELDLLLEAVYRRYGYDIRNYALSSLKRRLRYSMRKNGLNSLSEMIPRILHDKDFFVAMLSHLSVTVTEMFRDPFFYQALRKKIVPVLKTYPFIKVWVAGCSTGEEAYSLAILLQEEEYLSKVQMYATDSNRQALETAKEGIYPIEKIEQWKSSYLQSGGENDLFDYCQCKYKSARIDQHFRKNITFSYHNLVSDGCFGEMNLILCRNVLIYFNKKLQNRVLNLFEESLRKGGFLALGLRESLEFSSVYDEFETVMKSEKIYQKMYRIQQG